VFLVQAVLALGGVFLLLTVSIFSYFNDKVDQHIVDNTKFLFSKTETRSFLQDIQDRDLPAALIRDFSQELLKIAEPRRVFRRLLLLSPMTGCLFVVSAFLGSFSDSSGLVVILTPVLNPVVITVLLLGIMSALYCAVELARLSRRLA
jgi:hypothetical protein